MKGVIVNCLKELVTEKFGKDKWEAALEKAGLEKKSAFLVTQDIDDGVVLKVVGTTCAVLNISPLQAADAFGEHWSCTYAPKIYKAYYHGTTSAKDFLLKMDEIHRITTESIPNAKPPRFEYSWENDKTLIMKYKSHRGMIDFLVGLIKGVGKYFKENLKVSKLSADRVKVVFP
jgi:hypothetical protein